MSEVSRPIALPLHRQLRDLMIARIDSGEWSPGTYLPSETRLAEEYGVSVGTLRKALLDLAQEGDRRPPAGQGDGGHEPRQRCRAVSLLQPAPAGRQHAPPREPRFGPAAPAGTAAEAEALGLAPAPR
jgi:GntR family transcriptional regulator